MSPSAAAMSASSCRRFIESRSACSSRTTAQPLARNASATSTVRRTSASAASCSVGPRRERSAQLEAHAPRGLGDGHGEHLSPVSASARFPSAEAAKRRIRRSTAPPRRAGRSRRPRGSAQARRPRAAGPAPRRGRRSRSRRRAERDEGRRLEDLPSSSPTERRRSTSSADVTFGSTSSRRAQAASACSRSDSAGVGPFAISWATVSGSLSRASFGPQASSRSPRVALPPPSPARPSRNR